MRSQFAMISPASSSSFSSGGGAPRGRLSSRRKSAASKRPPITPSATSTVRRGYRGSSLLPRERGQRDESANDEPPGRGNSRLVLDRAREAVRGRVSLCARSHWGGREAATNPRYGH